MSGCSPSRPPSSSPAPAREPCPAATPSRPRPPDAAAGGPSPSPSLQGPSSTAKSAAYTLEPGKQRPQLPRSARNCRRAAACSVPAGEEPNRRVDHGSHQAQSDGQVRAPEPALGGSPEPALNAQGDCQSAQ